MLYRLARPALFRLDPERAHRATVRALATLPVPKARVPRGLGIEVAGLRFANPLGLAAGFDKDAECFRGAWRLGFGSVEVGSITPRPQEGNPRPRVFRLAEDGAVINRMGFNNGGGEAALARIGAHAGPPGPRAGVLGINIGANKDSADRIADYAAMTRMMAARADYLTVNISSPNTPRLRALQDEGALMELLDAVREAKGDAPAPIFLKVAPDLEPGDVDAIARIALDKRLGALVVSNTTITRGGLRSGHRDEQGGLSGAPLKGLALRRLREFRAATGGALALVGVGGIADADDAWERIRAGASLVQMYSAMVYGGPGLSARVLRGLARRMERDGFASIAEAVGSE